MSPKQLGSFVAHEMLITHLALSLLQRDPEAFESFSRNVLASLDKAAAEVPKSANQGDTMQFALSCAEELLAEVRRAVPAQKG